MAAVKTTRASSSEAKAAVHSASPGTQFAEVMAASRPPGGSIEKAERRCRRSASWRIRATPGVAENGGFITTAVGRRPARRSAMDSALWRVTRASGKSAASRPARTAAISFRCSTPAARVPSAHSAITASMPVPALGSSTTSPGRTAAARSAA